MKAELGAFLLRLVLGLLFLLAGIGKLMSPDGVIGMLGGMGFPIAAFFGWLLIIVEILFGLALLLGWQTRWTIWPLLVILVVATLVVHLPAFTFSSPGIMNVFWHLLGIAALVSLYLTGPGMWALGSNK